MQDERKAPTDGLVQADGSISKQVGQWLTRRLAAAADKPLVAPGSTVATFIAEWLAGIAGSPCIPCDALNLHEAYRRFCRDQLPNTKPVPLDNFMAALVAQPVMLRKVGPDDDPLTIVIPATFVGHDWVDLQECMNAFTVHLRGLTCAGQAMLQAHQHIRRIDADGQPAEQAQQHPSRSAPKCVDCAHYYLGDKSLGIGPYCTHPAAPVDPVTGHVTTRAAQARSERTEAVCGPAGKLFALRQLASS